MKTNNWMKLAVCAVLIFGSARANAQTPTTEEINFKTYLDAVGKKNLGWMAAQLDVAIADAEVIAAKTWNDPSFDFEGNHDTFVFGLSYSLGIGKRSARVKLAKSQKEYERLALEQGFHDLRAEAANVFLEAILQRELLAVKQQSYDYMAELSQKDSLRFAAGEITANDARQSRLEAQSLKNDYFDQRSEYEQAAVRLNQFMGIDSDTLRLPVGDWSNLEREFQLSELMDAGLDLRYDLKAAQQNIAVARGEVKVARRELRPDIDLAVSYERDWGQYRPEARYATIGVSVPLAFSSLKRGSVKAAKLRQSQAELQERDTELQVLAEIRQAWSAFEAQRNKVAQFREGMLEESEKVMEGMRFSYLRGENSIMDLLIAQRDYNEVRENYLQTMKEYVSSLVELEKACGIWDIYF